MRESYVLEDLKKSRGMRNAFKSGFVAGALQGGPLHAHEGRDRQREAAHGVRRGGGARRSCRPEPFTPDNELTFCKVDAVYKSGNQTRDDIPSHLVVGEDVPPEVADLYAAMCPAGVYERDGDKLVVNAPNCVDCRATDVIGPRWTPREGGSGPKYKRM